MGGSPEGVAVNEGNSDTPSGPLCFFLRVEKEEPAEKASNKRKDNLIIPHAGEFHPFNKLCGISVCTLRNLSVSVVYRIST